MIKVKSRRLKNFPLTESKLRVGFYLIVKIYKGHPEWKPEIEEWIAEAYFKERADTRYYWSSRKIRLKPLFNEFSTKFEFGNYDNCSTQLLYLGVKINEIRVIELKNVHGNPYRSYAIDWEEFGSYEEKQLHSILPESYDIYAMD